MINIALSLKASKKYSSREYRPSHEGHMVAMWGLLCMLPDVRMRQGLIPIRPETYSGPNWNPFGTLDLLSSGPPAVATKSL